MEPIATELYNLKKNIILIYAFNGTGKTRLSVAYKDVTKKENGGKHIGVYYNAYSEDLFVWDNDESHDGANIKMDVRTSNLNKYHQHIDEEKLNEYLKDYKPRFDYRFHNYENIADGIEYIEFYVKKEGSPDNGGDIHKDDTPIKLSRGEQLLFIWCFYLALFEVESFTGEKAQSSHFFIDDPVSSFDDHNIFVTVASIMKLIDRHYKKRKIIITTHHIGLYAILCDWLTKSEHKDSYRKALKTFILKRDGDNIKLIDDNSEVLLYHLELLQILQEAINENNVYAYHFALLRQVLESISSFLGVGRFSYVLEQLGIETDVANIINALSHKNVFKYEAVELVPDNKDLFVEIFNALMDKYQFVLHR